MLKNGLWKYDVILGARDSLGGAKVPELVGLRAGRFDLHVA